MHKNCIYPPISKSSDKKENVVIFSRFGPYHVARLKAAGKYFESRNSRILGIEIAEFDKANLWDVQPGMGEGYQRVTLFKNQNYHRLSKRKIANAVQRSLEKIHPCSVSVPGWGFPEARAGAKWAAQNQCPLIVMSESNRNDAERNWFKERVKEQIIKAFDAAFVGGSSHASYLESLGLKKEKIFFGYNVVDNEYFTLGARKVWQQNVQFRKKFNLPTDYFLASGRFIRKKNLRGLLKAYSFYRNLVNNEPWKLVICGDGPLKNDVVSLCESLNIADHVLLPGFIQYPDLPVYFGLARAFVHPSITEQWGLVVNEAMACSLPILVSQSCGCINELVDEGKNGYTFDPENPQQLAHLMKKLSGGEVNLGIMGNHSLQMIQNYSLNTFAEGLWNAVQKAMTSKYLFKKA